MASQDPYILQPQTLLDAVNTCLWAIGSQNILGLDTDSITSDGEAALQMVHRTSIQFQESGWWFNREYDLKIDPTPQTVPSVSDRGTINLPATTLKADCQGYVQRGNRLYDPVKHTFNIGVSLYVTVILGLDFNDLPQAGRNYVAARSARLFAVGKLEPTVAKQQFLQGEEVQAYVSLCEAEDQADERTIYQKNPQMIAWHRRRRYPR